MKTFKRVLAWTVVVISIIGILVCTLGIVGSWMINGQLTDGILKLLSAAQAPLASVEDSLMLVNTKVQAANSAITTVHASASKLGDRIEKNSPVLDLITRTLKQELSPVIDEVRDTFFPIRERILSINNTIEVLNALPGIQLPTLPPQLQVITDQNNKMADAVQELQMNVSDIKSGVVENRLVPFLDKIDKLTVLLTGLEQNIKTYVEQVNKLQLSIMNLQAKIPSIINTITLLISILFIWLVLAQVSLILVGRLYLKTGKMVWEFNSLKQPSEEVLPDPGT